MVRWILVDSHVGFVRDNVQQDNRRDQQKERQWNLAESKTFAKRHVGLLRYYDKGQQRGHRPALERRCRSFGLAKPMGSRTPSDGEATPGRNYYAVDAVRQFIQ